MILLFNINNNYCLGVLALKGGLNNMAITNRRDMFVHTDHQTQNVFYLRFVISTLLTLVSL